MNSISLVTEDMKLTAIKGAKMGIQ